jgi:hypothetical protein
MLNRQVQAKILAALSDSVLSTSMIARKAKLSRITVAKYLSAMASSEQVTVTRIGKALAWKATPNKPVVAIIAKTGTARIVELALGESFEGVLATSASQVPDAFLVVTDQAHVARAYEGECILIGGTEESAFCIPELFEIGELGALMRKIYLESRSVEVPASSCLSIEHIESAEEVFGFQGAEEIIALMMRVLDEHNIPFTQVERTYFLIDGPLPEAVLGDVEQLFHTILAHQYGEMVNPGEEMDYDGITHVVPCLTITLATPVTADQVARSTAEKH